MRTYNHVTFTKYGSHKSLNDIKPLKQHWLDTIFCLIHSTINYYSLSTFLIVKKDNKAICSIRFCFGVSARIRLCRRFNTFQKEQMNDRLHFCPSQMWTGYLLREEEGFFQIETGSRRPLLFEPSTLLHSFHESTP